MQRLPGKLEALSLILSTENQKPPNVTARPYPLYLPDLVLYGLCPSRGQNDLEMEHSASLQCPRQLGSAPKDGEDSRAAAGSGGEDGIMCSGRGGL